MLNHEQSRVLGRLGARELAVEEVEAVSGGLQFHTNVCTAILNVTTVTGPGDGDGCSDTDHS